MFCRSCSPRRQPSESGARYCALTHLQIPATLAGHFPMHKLDTGASTKFLATSGVPRGKTRPSHIFQPALPAVAGYVHRQLKAAPNPKLVESAAQMILDHLLGRAHELANLAIGQTLPHEGSHLKFFRG